MRRWSLIAAVLWGCVLDIPDVVDTSTDASSDVVIGGDAIVDAAYDAPDLGVGVNDSGLPCTCVGAVPSGYTIVEYVPNQRPTCSVGYSGPVDLLENPTAQASTCSCTCTSTPTTAPQCTCGNNPAVFNISSGNGNCTDVTTESLSASANQCYATSQSLNPGAARLNNMLAGPASACAPSGGACAAPTKTVTIPTASSDQGRACPLVAATGQCSSGLCVPSTAAPYAMCITNMTSGQCPADFPLAHTVGTSIADTRGCGPGVCACALTNQGTCNTPQLSLFDNSNCTSVAAALTADKTTCTSVGFGNGATFASAEYIVTHSGGACGFSGTFAPSGNLALSGSYTICCR